MKTCRKQYSNPSFKCIKKERGRKTNKMLGRTYWQVYIILHNHRKIKQRWGTHTNSVICFPLYIMHSSTQFAHWAKELSTLLCFMIPEAAQVRHCQVHRFNIFLIIWVNNEWRERRKIVSRGIIDKNCRSQHSINTNNRRNSKMLPQKIQFFFNFSDLMSCSDFFDLYVKYGILLHRSYLVVCRILELV